MEKLTLRFLGSLADSPNWENTISLVNEHHQTLAHLAVLFQYSTLLEKITQWGINVDVQDVNGFTALHCAYLCGDLDSVRILKSYGADEDIQDTLSRRPVELYIPRMNDQDKESPSNDRTSSPARIPSAGEEEREKELMVSPQPGTFGGHETTMGHSASRRQSLPTPIPSSMRGELSAAGEGWIDAVSELSLSGSPIPLEHRSSSIHFPSVPVATLEVAKSCQSEIEEIEEAFNKSTWLQNHTLEPVVGNPLCPAAAEEHGITGMSCYTALVEKYGDDLFGCRYEACRMFRINSIEDAVRHLRYHHFDHRPFLCGTWSVWPPSLRSPPKCCRQTLPFSKSATDSFLQPRKLPRTYRPPQSPIALPIGKLFSQTRNGAIQPTRWLLSVPLGQKNC
jgi:ankyrin repeat protein